METNLLAWIKTHQRWALIIGGSGLLLVGIVVVMSLMKRPVSDPAAPALATSQTVSNGQQSSGMKSMASGNQASRMSSASSGPMYVDVKGAVNQPGIYQVKSPMRVADVIALAKGLRPKADRLQVNLAEKVTDQQVIYVPEKGESKKTVASQTTAGSAGSATTATSGAKTTSSASGDGETQINLNTADVTELQKLAGVGQKKAEKIIEYRDSHNGFKTVDDLKQVSGIGDKTLEKFRSQLTV